MTRKTQEVKCRAFFGINKIDERRSWELLNNNKVEHSQYTDGNFSIVCVVHSLSNQS